MFCLQDRKKVRVRIRVKVRVRIRVSTCTYQGVRNVIFFGKFCVRTK